jgi:hypothetical protein
MGTTCTIVFVNRSCCLLVYLIPEEREKTSSTYTIVFVNRSCFLLVYLIPEIREETTSSTMNNWDVTLNFDVVVVVVVVENDHLVTQTKDLPLAKDYRASLAMYRVIRQMDEWVDPPDLAGFRITVRR